jgi:hypothetical protein
LFYAYGPINYLRAKYVFLQTTPQVHIKVRPFRSFVSDIHFVNAELGLDDGNDRDAHDNLTRSKELVDNRDAYIKALSKEAYRSMLMMNILDIQKDLCDSISISPHIISLLYPKRQSGISLPKTYRNWATILLDFPIRIHLSGIPLKNGAETDYKKGCRSQIKQQVRLYLRGHPIFYEFQSPILISVFCMPPRSRKEHYKDIDNNA